MVARLRKGGYVHPAEEGEISDGWIWMYWVSPIAWAIRGAAVNEFRADKYDKCAYQASGTSTNNRMAADLA